MATAALGALLIGAGALSFLALQAPSSSTGTTAPRTSTVQQGSLQTTVGATGNVQAASAWSVGFEVAGKITSVLGKVGDKVDAGARLATLDPASAQTALRQAKDALGTAQTKLAEAQAAVATATNATAATDAVLTDEDAVNTASDKVAQAQAALDQTTLRSPAAGTITSASGVVGQQVSASGVSSASATTASTAAATSGSGSSTGSSSGLFTITDLSSLQVRATLAEADSTKVKPGQPVALSFDALPDVKLAGKVASVALTATVSSNVVSYETVVTLVNPPETVRAGMTASATITTATRDGVLRIPTAAARGAGAASTVSVLNADGTQTTRRIVIGMRGDDAVEVVSGLKVGEKVVTSSGVTTTASTVNRSSANRAGGAAGGGLGGGGLGAPPGGAGPGR